MKRRWKSGGIGGNSGNDLPRAKGYMAEYRREQWQSMGGYLFAQNTSIILESI